MATLIRCAAALCGAGSLLALSLSAALAEGARSTRSPQPVAQPTAAANWPSHNGDSNETAFSRLRQIDRNNVARLGLAWSLDLPGEASLQATPIAVDGIVYFTGSYATVYAVDGVSGKALWRFAPETWKYAPNKLATNLSVNRGVAYADGRIFSAALDGRLFALDGKTGRLIWSVDTVPLSSPRTITGAPRTFKGMVIIGNADSEYGDRGYATAYSAATGKLIWRFYSTPGTPAENKGDPAMERAAETWKGEFWKVGTGGLIWDGITYDAELNRIYLGIGNGAPYDPEVRSPGGGDNLYVSSIVAVDADTGRYIWHYQENPRDAWDYDATEQMTLADLTIDGKNRKVIMQAPKNGFLYVLDRETGKLISAGKIGKVTWADHIDIATGRPVEEKDIRYESGQSDIWPSPAGAHSWMSQAFSPETALIYIPYMQSGVRFRKAGVPEEGALVFAGLSFKEHATDPMDGKGALLGWDPVHQRAAWRAPRAEIWNGGVLATAGNLVVQGTADGYLRVHDAASGKELWRFYVGMGINGAPMSFSGGGKQYVSVLAGYGGGAAVWGDLTNVGWKFTSPRRLLTFALDATTKLPPTPAPDKTVHALDNPSLKINPADVAAGHSLFMFCAACHGGNLVATGGPGPDLRESQIALDPDRLYAVLHDGILMPNGMPRFESLSRPQVLQLYAYIRAGASEAITPQKPSP